MWLILSRDWFASFKIPQYILQSIELCGLMLILLEISLELA